MRPGNLTVKNIEETPHRPKDTNPAYPYHTSAANAHQSQTSLKHIKYGISSLFSCLQMMHRKLLLEKYKGLAILKQYLPSRIIGPRSMRDLKFVHSVRYKVNREIKRNYSLPINLKKSIVHNK